jgi:hypothetical protein
VFYQLSQNGLTTRQEQLNERLFTTTFRDMEMHPILFNFVFEEGLDKFEKTSSI